MRSRRWSRRQLGRRGVCFLGGTVAWEMGAEGLGRPRTCNAEPDAAEVDVDEWQDEVEGGSDKEIREKVDHRLAPSRQTGWRTAKGQRKAPTCPPLGELRDLLRWMRHESLRARRSFTLLLAASRPASHTGARERACAGAGGLGGGIEGSTR